MVEDDQEINKIKKMIVKQEYDTESANMIFGEEDIDWKVMNIKMTIDKTGNQHPSWVYTPLYTKDLFTSNVVDSSKDDQILIQQHPVNVVQEDSEDFDTISVNEEFEVEEAEWKKDEAFRLTFDPTGKLNPQIQLLIKRRVPVDSADAPLPPTPTTEEFDATDNAPVTAREPTPELVREPSPEPVREPTPEPVREPSPEPIVVKTSIKKHIGGSVRVKGEKTFDGLDIATSGTFILPDIHKYGRELGEFIKDELIDIHMLNKLTITRGINWWVDIPGCIKLQPLWLNQDGKSFLSAINFLLYGFHDKKPSIQNGLYSMLQNPLISKTMKQRWMYEVCIEQTKMGNSMYSSDHLEKRWVNVIQGGWCRYIQYIHNNPEVDTPPPEGCKVEPIHVYMIANVLRRPIVVVTGINEMEVSNEEELEGIYVPFEHGPEECHKFPILLGYNHENLHFCPLVTAADAPGGKSIMANASTQTTVPVTDGFLSLLPVHFAVDPSAEWEPNENGMSDEITELNNEQTLEEIVKYLHITSVQFSRSSDVNQDGTKVYNKLVAAKVNISKKPEGYEDLLRNYIKGAKNRFKQFKKIKCKTPKCKRMPSSQLQGVCIKCYQQAQISAANEVEQN